MTAAFLLSFALLGGWISRMCGGGPPKLPLGLDQWIYALPYGACGVAVMASGAVEAEALFLLLPYFGAFLGKRTGHGGGIDLGTSPRIREPEALEFIIKPLHGRIPEYWYDALLLAVTGLAVTILAGLVVALADPLAGLAVALSGALKAPAYKIGRAIYPHGRGRGIPELNEATAIGEFLTGVAGWGVAGWAVWHVAGLGGGL